MNRNLFFSLIQNPESLNENTIEPLASIVADYPYFQAARMLYLKNLWQEESLKYPIALKQSAAFITHRDKLYRLIYSVNTKQVDIDTRLSHLDEDEVDDVLPEVEVSTKSNERSVADDFFEVSDIFDFSELTPVDISHQIESNDEEPFLLEHESLQNSGYLLEEDSKSEELDDSNLSFTDWIKRVKSKPVVASPKPAKPTNEKMELINNFLKAKPKIIPRMVDVNEDAEAPKRGFVEPDSLLTETLANIYIKQKHYDKAINIFERLHLKYPEKSVYFANRINEIEKLSNNNNL